MLCFSVCVCFYSKSTVSSPCCSILSLKMVGADFIFRQTLISVRVFPLSYLVFWTFAAFLSFLITLVFHTHFDAFGQRFGGTPSSSCFQNLRT